MKENGAIEDLRRSSLLNSLPRKFYFYQNFQIFNVTEI